MKKLTLSQTTALNTDQQSICINANAGTGKTTILISRILRLLQQKNCSLNQILAITYTDKAAQEMRERLSKEMKLNGLDYWSVETSYISTIHAFCSRLLKENCFAAGINPGFSILNEIEALLLLEEIIEECITEELNNDAPEIIQALDVYPKQTLIESIVEIINKMKAAGLEMQEPLQSSWSKLEAYCQTILPELLKNLETKTQGLNSCITGSKKLEELRNKALSLRGKELAEYIPSIKFSGVSAKEEDQEAYEQFKALTAKLKEDAAPILRIINQTETDESPFIETTNYLLKLASLSALRFDQAKQKTAVMDYEDLQLKALALLKNHPQIRKNYQQQFIQIMIDEFQDTNNLQTQIFEMLRSPDNLFIVGDWKQSIYLFRNADVSLFQKYINAFQNNEGVYIRFQENFRSNKQIIDFANYLCGKLLPNYEPLICQKENAPAANPVSINFFTQGKEDKADEIREKEALLVAKKIKELKDSGKNFKEMAILLKVTSALEIYEEALKGQEIPYYVVGGRGYFDKPEIVDVLHYLKIVDNPYDDLGLTGVLRSELVNIRDETLLLLSLIRTKENKTFLFEALQSELIKTSAILPLDQLKLLEFIRIREELLSCVGKLPIAQVIALLIEKTALRSVALTKRKNSRRIIANLNKLIDLSKSFGEKNYSLSKFVRHIELLQVREAREDEAVVENENSDVVRIMTVHKAKGMEFPIVLLPDIYRDPKAQDNNIVFSHHLYNQLPLGISYKDESKEAHVSLAYELIHNKQELEMQAESKRLLYVALTRAEEQLHIFSRIKQDKEYTETVLDGVNWGEWLGYLYQADSAMFNQNIQVIFPPSPALPRLHGEGSKPQTNVPAPWLPQKFDLKKYLRPVDDSGKFGKLSATQISELLTDQNVFYKKHYLGIDLKQYNPDYTARGEFSKAESEQIGRIAHSFIENNILDYAEKLDKIGMLTKKQTEHITLCLKNYFCSDVSNSLSNGAEHYFELPYEYKEKDFRFDGRIDLVYKKENTWHIVDFKTNTSSPENLQEYTYQLSVYGYIFSKLVNAPVVLNLFFLAENKLIEVKQIPDIIDQSIAKL